MILAYANNGGKDAGKRAYSILTKMENRFNDGDLEIKPTSSTYTSLIKCELDLLFLNVSYYFLRSPKPVIAQQHLIGKAIVHVLQKR